MCKRACPKTNEAGQRCGSTDHIELYGLIGSYIVCNDCGTILANRRDIEAAPTNLTEAEAIEWVKAGTFVLPGAEAEDPADDEIYTKVEFY
jgi:hypothetical protein